MTFVELNLCFDNKNSLKKSDKGCISCIFLPFYFMPCTKITRVKAKNYHKYNNIYLICT